MLVFEDFSSKEKKLIQAKFNACIWRSLSQFSLICQIHINIPGFRNDVPHTHDCFESLAWSRTFVLIMQSPPSSKQTARSTVTTYTPSPLLSHMVYLSIEQKLISHITNYFAFENQLHVYKENIYTYFTRAWWHP